MTLLDDARRLLEIGVQCDHCTGSPTSGHLGDCPLPKLVAALEDEQAVWAELAEAFPEQAGRGQNAWAMRVHTERLDYDDALYLIELTIRARWRFAAAGTIEADAS